MMNKATFVAFVCVFASATTADARLWGAFQKKFGKDDKCKTIQTWRNEDFEAVSVITPEEIQAVAEDDGFDNEWEREIVANTKHYLGTAVVKTKQCGESAITTMDFKLYSWFSPVPKVGTGDYKAHLHTTPCNAENRAGSHYQFATPDNPECNKKGECSNLGTNQFRTDVGAYIEAPFCQAGSTTHDCGQQAELWCSCRPNRYSCRCNGDGRPSEGTEESVGYYIPSVNAAIPEETGTLSIVVHLTSNNKNPKWICFDLVKKDY